LYKLFYKNLAQDALVFFFSLMTLRTLMTLMTLKGLKNFGCNSFTQTILFLFLYYKSVKDRVCCVIFAFSWALDNALLKYSFSKRMQRYTLCKLPPNIFESFFEVFYMKININLIFR